MVPVNKDTLNSKMINLFLQVNLVCDDALMVSLAQTIFYAGVLVGSIVLGQVSDV